MNRSAWKTTFAVAGPLLALGLGILAQVFARHTIAFAPKAVALLALSWALAAALGQWLPEPRPGGAPAVWRARLRAAGGTIIVSLLRNVLFFLVPIWFASATISSPNILAPIVLGAAALLSCFPGLFRRRVLDRPRRRTLWCSAVLFAALVPAVAVETAASPRVSAALAAAIAWVTASLTGSRRGLRGTVGRAELVSSAVVAALACALIAPILPPVPVACSARATGTGLRNRELEGIAARFPAGTRRVYAWFAVRLPPHYRQGIRLEWYRDGRPAGQVAAREIVGGRAQGYRVSAFTASPGPGEWRVDLLTDASQLITRAHFQVAD